MTNPGSLLWLSHLLRKEAQMENYLSSITPTLKQAQLYPYDLIALGYLLFLTSLVVVAATCARKGKPKWLTDLMNERKVTKEERNGPIHVKDRADAILLLVLMLVWGWEMIMGFHGSWVLF
jgi:hypothetical protein